MRCVVVVESHKEQPPPQEPVCTRGRTKLHRVKDIDTIQNGFGSFLNKILNTTNAFYGHGDLVMTKYCNGTPAVSYDMCSGYVSDRGLAPPPAASANALHAGL